MILACPSCGARFEVEAPRLGREGRRVRCGRCAHQWRAYPEDAVASAGPAMPRTETAPPTLPQEAASPRDSVGQDTAARLDADERQSAAAMAARFDALGNASPAEGPAEEPRRAARSRLGHSGAAEAPAAKGSRRGLLAWLVLLLVILGLLAGLYLARDRVVELVPETAAGYEALGIDVRLDPTRTLELDVEQPQRVEIDGQSVLIVTGSLRNRLSIEQDLPPLSLLLLSAAGEEVLRVPVPLDRSSLEAGESTDFVVEVADLPETANEISLVFEP